MLIVCRVDLSACPRRPVATWPDSLVQTCVVHPGQGFYAVRGLCGSASRPAKALKPVYTAPNEEAALGALAEFSDQWGDKYPDTVASWERAWERWTGGWFLDLGDGYYSL